MTSSDLLRHCWFQHDAFFFCSFMLSVFVLSFTMSGQDSSVSTPRNQHCGNQNVCSSVLQARGSGRGSGTSRGLRSCKVTRRSRSRTAWSSTAESRAAPCRATSGSSTSVSAHGARRIVCYAAHKINRNARTITQGTRTDQTCT